MPGVSTSADRRRGKGLHLPLLCAALFLALYMPVIVKLVGQWLTDDNYRHGLLVPVVAAILLWQRRGALRDAPAGGGIVPGAVMILAAAVLLVGGTAASELFTTRLSIPLMLIGILLVAAGPALVRAAAAPLLLLFMMIPLPYIVFYKISFPLQLLSARFSAVLLGILRAPVIRKGNVLHLPDYALEVVAACSGLRSLMTMITLALVLAAVSRISNARKAALVAFAVPIAVAANTVRLVTTALGAYLIGPAFADGPLHRASGIIVFLTGLVMLLVTWGLLKWRRIERRDTSS